MAKSKAKATKTVRAKGKTAAASAKGKVAAAVHLGQARRDEFDALVKRIAALKGKEAEQWDALWEAVGEAIEATEGAVALYRAKHASLEAFVKAVLAGETVRSVKRNVLVAGAFTGADYKRHGEGLLEEVAMFVMAQSGARVPPKALNLDRVRIPVKAKGGRVIQKPARECVIEEVRKARRELAGAPAKKAPIRVRAVKSALARVATLRAVGVSERTEGFAFSGVTEETFKPFAKVLSALRLPPAEEG
jgi:hypothetical protein